MSQMAMIADAVRYLKTIYGEDPSEVGVIDGTEDDYGDLLCEAYRLLGGGDDPDFDDDRWQEFQTVAQASYATAWGDWLLELAPVVAPPPRRRKEDHDDADA